MKIFLRKVPPAPQVKWVLLIPATPSLPLYTLSTLRWSGLPFCLELNLFSQSDDLSMREKFIPSRCPPILNVMGGIKILPVKDIPHDTFILFYNFFNSKFELKVVKLWDKVNFDNEMSFFLSSISLGSAVTNTLFFLLCLSGSANKISSWTNKNSCWILGTKISLRLDFFCCPRFIFRLCSLSPFSKHILQDLNRGGRCL